MISLLLSHEARDDHVIESKQADKGEKHQKSIDENKPNIVYTKFYKNVLTKNPIKSIIIV